MTLAQAQGLVLVLGVGLVATIVGLAARRWDVPAPSILVLVGVAYGLLPGAGRISLSPQAVSLGVLPPLLYAAAEELPREQLHTLWRPVAVLAVGLVAVSASAVAGVAAVVAPQLSLTVAFVLGAILASTDPVAVTALARRLHLPARLATLVQAESLGNDATSLVLFRIAVAAVGTQVSVAGLTVDFVRLALGGVALGLACGLGLTRLLSLLAARPRVQLVAALAGPYATAGLAELAGVSAVTALIVAGLLLAHRGQTLPGRQRMRRGYEVVVLLLESSVFALIGVEVVGFVRQLDPDERGRFVPLVLAVAGALVAVRALALVAGLVLRRLARGSELPVDWAGAAVATWAGARGVIPLVAALSVPLTVTSGAAFPHRRLLLAVAVGVVAVTLVVQGLTLAPLARRLGLAERD